MNLMGKKKKTERKFAEQKRTHNCNGIRMHSIRTTRYVLGSNQESPLVVHYRFGRGRFCQSLASLKQVCFCAREKQMCSGNAGNELQQVRNPWTVAEAGWQGQATCQACHIINNFQRERKNFLKKKKKVRENFKRNLMLPSGQLLPYHFNAACRLDRPYTHLFQF